MSTAKTLDSFRRPVVFCILYIFIIIIILFYIIPMSSCKFSVKWNCCFSPWSDLQTWVGKYGLVSFKPSWPAFPAFGWPELVIKVSKLPEWCGSTHHFLFRCVTRCVSWMGYCTSSEIVRRHVARFSENDIFNLNESDRAMKFNDFQQLILEAGIIAPRLRSCSLEGQTFLGMVEDLLDLISCTEQC